MSALKIILILIVLIISVFVYQSYNKHRLQMKNYRLYLKKHITIFLGIHENDFYSLSDMRNLEDKNATDIGVFRKSIKELSNDNRVFTLAFEKRL